MLARAPHIRGLRPRMPRRIACTALRTNLKVRELAASLAISKSAAHLIISTMTPRLAALGAQHYPFMRSRSYTISTLTSCRTGFN